MLSSEICQEVVEVYEYGIGGNDQLYIVMLHKVSNAYDFPNSEGT